MGLTDYFLVFRFQSHGTQIKLVTTVFFPFFLLNARPEYSIRLWYRYFAAFNYFTLLRCLVCLVVLSLTWAFLVWSCEQHLFESILRSVTESFTSTQCNFIGKAKKPAYFVFRVDFLCLSQLVFRVLFCFCIHH